MNPANTLAPPPAWKRSFDTVSIWLTAYSLVCLFAELELDPKAYGGGWWYWNEWAVTLLFTVEYVVRWGLSRHRLRYPITPMAVIDLLSVLPFYLSLVVDSSNLDVFRVLRVVRVFRLYRNSESLLLFLQAYHRCRHELLAVVTVVMVVVIVSSTLMYYLEHPVQPDKVAKPSDAVWWCVVTLSTVGYGDIAPVTMWGRMVGAATVVVGVASYGVFLTLFGGAWIDVLRDRREQRQQDPPPPASMSA
ncbi:MAG: potassium channel family protein [Fimbriiglobus sp.]|nr:potassium channel family protein [Fimbriiglobus sp.]